MMTFLRNICATISLSAFVLFQPVFLSITFADEQGTIARIDGRPITIEDVEQRVATKLYRLRWEIYNTIRTEAQTLADERLLVEEAKRRGTTVEELLQAEVNGKTSPPTDEEVDAHMRGHGVTNTPGDDARNHIAAYLAERAAIQRKLDFLDELRKKADYQFLLEPPERPRARVDIDGDPMRGNAEAPITIIHFAGFSCEHCAGSAGKIRRLLEEFPGIVRWVHRDFLNLFDERGLRAAEAGETAHAHGKFWKFHDYIYSLSGEFEQDDLGRILEEVGVDASEYEQAHTKALYIIEIKQDIEDGVQAGVTGVPAIFINGRYISGTFAFERLKSAVEEELRVLKGDPRAERDSSP